MITAPNLPTDNLYKFIALSGIFLCVLTFSYPEIKKREIKNENIISHGEISKTNIERLKLKEAQKKLKQRIDIIIKKSGCNCKAIVNDSLIKFPVIEGGSKELIDLGKELEKSLESYSELVNQFNYKQKEIDTKIELINNKQNEISELEGVSNILTPFFILMTIGGFLMWYNKTQKFQDKILEEQYLSFQKNVFCQSCGIRFSNLDNYSLLTEEERKKLKYCSNCFSDGRFTDQELTLKKMILKIKKRCKELKYSQLQTLVFINHIKKLDRWTEKFKW